MLKRKMIAGFAIAGCVALMSSQVFASVTFSPNKNEDIVIENIEEQKVTYDPFLNEEVTKDNVALQIEYTLEDAGYVLDLYKAEEVTAEDLAKYDMDNNGIINVEDAAIILDLIK